MSGEYGTYADAWQPDNETAVRFGCLRIQDGLHDTTDPDYITNPGLYILGDSGHTSVGITQVRIEKSTGRVVVDTDGAVNGVPLVNADETGVAGGYRYGATGGSGGQIRIQVVKIGVGVMDLADQAVYTTVASEFHNVWFAWLSPLVRGVGDPSKADQALALLGGVDVVALAALYAALDARVAALESGCE